MLSTKLMTNQTLTEMETTAREAEPAVSWLTTPGLVDYPSAISAMEARVAAIHSGTASEAIWLLQHPPIYTAGTSAKPGDLKNPARFPVFETGRGGQFTYHGPGQRVAYVMLNVRQRFGDVRAFVSALEHWIVSTLAEFGIIATTHPDRVGVWVPGSGTETGHDDKIAAIGIRLRRWISYHGVAINVHPDLSHFDGIVPCGITDHGVTSMTDLGKPVTLAEFDSVLRRTFEAAFQCSTRGDG